MKRSGFTLIELIVVMALSAILLTIIAIPLINSLNLTRAAQGFAEAQSKARQLIARIETELGNAAAVRDNTGDRGSLNIVIPSDSGADVTVQLPFSKLDFVKPAEGDPTLRQVDPGSGKVSFIDPDTGKVDPTLGGPKGQTTFPAAPGNTMVRYWIGLRDPFSQYSNPYVRYRTSSGALWQVDRGGQDNLYVLWRAEVPMREWENVDADPEAEWVGNNDFFERDAVSGGPVIDDPDFFTVYPGDPAAKLERVQRWMNQGTIVTEVSRYDMVMPEVDQASQRLALNGTVPQVVPLVRFQPTRINAEPALGQTAVGTGDETANAEKVGPDVFTTEYGMWSSLFMTVYPGLYPTAFGPGPASAGAVRAPYQVGSRFIFSQDDPGLGQVLRGSDNSLLFSVQAYHDARNSVSPYPFTQAVAPASYILPWSEYFVPVVPDPSSGRVSASFDIREVGSLTSGAFGSFENRGPTIQNAMPNEGTFQPGVHVGPAIPQQQDVTDNNPQANWASFDWFDWKRGDVGVNRRFNKLWDAFPGLAPNLDRAEYVKRFIDLRDVPQPGAPSPLGPTSAEGSGWARASIVPGSEVIVGPDQRPGSNYGRYVRYTRTTQRPVGPNQYYINYVDQIEPDWAALGFAGADYDPMTYNPTNFLSAILQAQYRAGYVELNSRYGEPIPDSDLAGNPTGRIFVTYRFQFTEPADVVTVDYDSAEHMEIVLTVRNYAQTTLPSPQNVTVRGSAEVRNFLR